LFKANSLDVSGNETSVLVTGKSVFIIPGSRNVAGDTDVPALMPLQPAAHSPIIASIASHAKFQFNLTSRL
jgi:hypothetical protein